MKSRLRKTARLAPAFIVGAIFGGGNVPAPAQTPAAKTDVLPRSSIAITSDVARVAMGKAVKVTAVSKRLGQPVRGQELWAYVNGKQWGAQGITDENGTATFILPLPYAGTAKVQVAAPPPDFQWPAPSKIFGQTSVFTVGTPLSPQSAVSNALNIAVAARKFAPFIDPEHLIGAQTYPWHTKYNLQINGGYSSSEAVPILGSYHSNNPDVIRQQILWMNEIGVNFLQHDWSNNLSQARHWDERLPGVKEMVVSTTALLDTLAQMRREGLPTPQVQLLLGMAPPFSMAALNEEMKFVHDTYVMNPKYDGLFVTYLGKPLTTVLSVLDDEKLPIQGAVDNRISRFAGSGST